MKLTHNFRNYYRKVFSKFETISRLVLVLLVFAIFLFSLFFIPADLNFIKSESVKGAVSVQNGNVDVSKFLAQAAEDIALGRMNEARQKIDIVLEFDPSNIYANEMHSNLTGSHRDVEREISQTLQVIKLQPNWREAWVKLADLYERAGNPKLAAEAREKARGLKTS